MCSQLRRAFSISKPQAKQLPPPHSQPDSHKAPYGTSAQWGRGGESENATRSTARSSCHQGALPHWSADSITEKEDPQHVPLGCSWLCQPRSRRDLQLCLALCLVTMDSHAELCGHARTFLQDRVTLSTWGRAMTCRWPHARSPSLTCRQASIAAEVLGGARLRGDLSHTTVPWQ